MYRELFIKDFSALGELLTHFANGQKNESLLSDAIEKSLTENHLFSKEMQIYSIKSLAQAFLSHSELEKWTVEYRSQICESNSVVTVIMAGNIPLVGFHDFLTILAAGRKAEIKLSSKDRYLLPAIVNILYDINSYWRERVGFCNFAGDKSNLIIATGGDESALHFSRLFKSAPSIIRGSRSSIAILSGRESNSEIILLSDDMFLYYGRGCRSVSTIMIPAGSNISELAKAINHLSHYSGDINFNDSYRYQKAIAAVSGEWFVDGGFFIFKNATSIPPPIGVVGVVWYSSVSDIDEFLENNSNSIQCVVNYSTTKGMVMYGKAQMPTLTDYADGINSLEFILKNS